MKIVSTKEIQKREPGYNDFTWLKKQALDENTLQIIQTIEQDEDDFHTRGIVTQGDQEMTLRFKQGVFHTTRATDHSIANIFVQIFKSKEHMQSSGFTPKDRLVVVDMGANEGYYTISMAKDNPNTRVFAIEPNPIAYDLLSKNIRANHLRNVETINSAVWNSVGIGEFNILPQVTSIGTMTPTESSFMSSAQQRVVHIPVRTITLASLIDTFNLSRIDILKIDIEGGELEVLRTSLNVLDIVDRLVIEYHSQDLKNALIELLCNKGYRLELHVPDRADFGDLYFVKQGILS